MKVRHRQQLGLALSQPFLGGSALTLGAVPIAAAVVGNKRMRAVLAARDMTTERRRAAALDRRHHLQLLEADVPGIRRTPGRPMIPTPTGPWWRQFAVLHNPPAAVLA